MLAARRRSALRAILLDRSLESLPLFRLSDSGDDQAIAYTTRDGGRWRVLPAPGERLPGTFDQDVYVELLRRYSEAGAPDDGVIGFTLHSFLRSMGRRVDGRTYEQVRGALGRLERTVLESAGAYYDAALERPVNGTFTVLTSVVIDRRRIADRDQFALFTNMATGEPGIARVTLANQLRTNVAAGHAALLSGQRYMQLGSPVARRLYRLLEVARAEGVLTWRIALHRLAEQLPLTQRYPSHLQRVLQPAHEMLIAAELVRDVSVKQHGKEWMADYVLASRTS